MYIDMLSFVPTTARHALQRLPALRYYSSKMGAIVKKTGPVDTNERVQALRKEMQKENVQA